MFSKLFQRKSADKIVAQYSSYADFARDASKSEKEIVIKQAIQEANELQRQVAAHAK